MKKTGIFFDFDGTLFYGTTDINYYSINLALQDMNRPPISREEANTTVGDRLEDACRRILHSDDQDLCARLLQGIIDHSPEAIRRYAAVEPDCVHMLQTLSRQVPLAICSNAEPGYLFALLDQFNIRRYFTYIWHRTPGYEQKSGHPRIKKAAGCGAGCHGGRSGGGCLLGQGQRLHYGGLARTTLEPGTPSARITMFIHTENWSRRCFSSLRREKERLICPARKF